MQPFDSWKLTLCPLYVTTGEVFETKWSCFSLFFNGYTPAFLASVDPLITLLGIMVGVLDCYIWGTVTLYGPQFTIRDSLTLKSAWL